MRIFVMTFATLSTLLFMPVRVEARADDSSPTSWSDEDYGLYPAFCRARLLHEPKELEAYWIRQIGPKNYLHMHHFCFGLKALTLAYANFNNASRRESMAGAVIDNFGYIVEHTERGFYMRSEALVNLGRGYILKKEYEMAKRKFEAALKLNPKSVDAWVALSDMYYQNGQRSDALDVLEKAREEAGDHKKILLRIDTIKTDGRK